MQDKTIPVKAMETSPIGLDQLRFFVQMVRCHLDEIGLIIPTYDAHFWKTMRKRCPELAQAIDTAFTGPWSTITFTDQIASPTLTYGDLEAATEAVQASNERHKQEGGRTLHEQE